MRNFLICAMLAVPFAAHAIVGTTSKTAAPAADSVWTGVGQINGASGVAIGPHLILTAGHVGAGNFTLDGTAYTLAGSTKAPNSNGTTTDLLLITVKETLPTWYTVADKVSTGATATLVGFGSTGFVNSTGKGYTLTSSGTRHAATNVISSKETDAGRGSTMRAMLDFAGDGAVAGGDSGGGWFVNGQLVGISDYSFSMNTSMAAYGWSKSYFGSGAINLTDSALNSWLDAAVSADITTTAKKGIHPQAVPEPSALLGLALGGSVLLRRKKK